jgi:hypothetical protein|tara:strand:+ start:232 stop:393 length:162 start_codon:yes stop_codon:yes gene_type:complete
MTNQTSDQLDNFYGGAFIIQEQYQPCQPCMTFHIPPAYNFYDDSIIDNFIAIQ